ncbi:MAG: cyclic 2,3-diphosphoglycerate synthase [Alphaproteobacteria bacterium]|nr:cyclic 2,3-diphosphoglycerate synthase [Alphaproteobacteria bacterium]
MAEKRIVIMGAAGRDFHNFNIVYRDNPSRRVVAFTATQIPEIAGRRYPPSLAGPSYPDGIPIVEEAALGDQDADEVVFAYSDARHEDVMHKASLALALGADFTLLGPNTTMLRSRRPVIAVSAVRTGCGKSQVTRYLAKRLRAIGMRVAAIRHPMPYGDLAAQAVQRFATAADLDAADCTIEEREEYEPHLALNVVVYAGVDYGAILAKAEAEADVILWDGGNNDFPFYRPDLHIVLVDPLRPGDEIAYHPGEAALRMADIVVLAKAEPANPEALTEVRQNVAALAPGATVLRGASPVTLGSPVAGKVALVVEDGPTLTHGGMAYGAGFVAARDGGALVIDPREAARGDIAALYEQYPHIGPVLPAVGYYPDQLAALAATINASHADVVVSGTPCDLSALIEIDKPVVRARYEYAELDTPGLGDLVDAFLKGSRP